MTGPSNQWVSSLKKNGGDPGKPVVFFKGHFSLDKPGDTYIDMSGYKKGIIWVNGNNLGRYWEIGPQKRVYCPVGWLKQGQNEIVVLDLHQTEVVPVSGFELPG